MYSFYKILPIQEHPKPRSFTDEQEELYQHRYEEGYNLYTDICYVNWLEIHHPEALPK